MKVKGLMTGALSAFLLMGSTALAVDVTGGNDYCLYIDRATETDVVIHKRGSHPDVKVIVINYDDNDRMESVFTETLSAEGELVDGLNWYKYSHLGIRDVKEGSKVMLWVGDENGIEPVRREVDATTVKNVKYSNVGIAENMYPIDGSKDYKVDIVTANGMFTYTVDYTDVSRLYESIYEAPDLKRNIAIRAIEYNVDDAGTIEFDFYGVTRNSVIGTHDSTYLESDVVSTIENSKIVYDVDKYREDGTWTAFSAEDLQDGWKYYIREYVTDSGEGTPLVTISAEKPAVVDQMRMAVFVADDETSMTAYVDNQLVTLPVNAQYNLATGDAFFYQKDENGVVIAIEPIFKESVPETYTELYNRAITNNLDVLNQEIADEFTAVNGKDSELVFGIITEFYNSTSDCVDLLTKDTLKDITRTDISSHTKEYDIANEANVYVYDYDYTKVKNRVEDSTVLQFKALSVPRTAEVDEDGEVINYTHSSMLDADCPDYGNAKFALCKIVDDEIVEALVIIPSSTK